MVLNNEYTEYTGTYICKHVVAFCADKQSFSGWTTKLCQIDFMKNMLYCYQELVLRWKYTQIYICLMFFSQKSIVWWLNIKKLLINKDNIQSQIQKILWNVLFQWKPLIRWIFMWWDYVQYIHILHIK